MTATLSKNVFELFSGSKRARLVPTLAIAVAVTALVVIPLTMRAIDASDSSPPVVAADPALVMFDMVESEPAALDGATLHGSALISYRDTNADGVSFALFAHDGDEPLMVSLDAEGPSFDLLVSDTGGGTPLDTLILPDGRYDLFVTATAGDGEQRIAVSFVVENS
jgi:hypothetical protein